MKIQHTSSPTSISSKLVLMTLFTLFCYMMASSQGMDRPLLSKAPKQFAAISSAEYQVHRYRDGLSPFRHPFAKVPLTPMMESAIDQSVEGAINSFDYEYPINKGRNQLFSVYSELIDCPWEVGKKLLHIGITTAEGESVDKRVVAKDVQIKVEFNPAYVESYRIVGFEDPISNFSRRRVDDSVNSDLSTGQSLTSLYIITPSSTGFESVEDKLLYQSRAQHLIDNRELGIVRIDYKNKKGRKIWQKKHKIAAATKYGLQIDDRTHIAAAIAESELYDQKSPYMGKRGRAVIMTELSELPHKRQKNYDEVLANNAKEGAIQRQLPQLGSDLLKSAIERLVDIDHP